MNYIKRGDTIKLAVSFFNKAGIAINFTGWTVKLLITKRFDIASVIHSSEEVTFSGDESNIASFVIANTETADYPLCSADLFVIIENQTEKYSSKSMFCQVSDFFATDLDVKKLKINDDIIVKLEDDIDLDESEQLLETQALYGEEQVLYNSEVISY